MLTLLVCYVKTGVLGKLNKLLLNEYSNGRAILCNRILKSHQHF